MKYIHSNCAFCGKAVTRTKQAASANVKRHFCDMSCKANFQRLAKPVTKEWLFDRYVNKGMDCVQIGAEVGRDPKSVWNWLKDFGIPTRPRGTGWQKNLVIGEGESNPFYGRKHSKETREKLREISINDGRVPWGKGNPHPRLSGEKCHNWKGGITAERQAFYSTIEWRSVSKKVRKRDRNCCQKCGKRASKDESLHIHHIVSFKCKELRATLENLILLCSHCHRWVHSNNNKNKEFIQYYPLKKD